MLAYRAGRLEQARAGFVAACEAFQQSGDDARAAEAANNLCVVLLRLRRNAESLEVVQGTPQRLETAGLPLEAAQAWGNLASALAACGRLEEAEEAFREAASRFEVLGDLEGRGHCLRGLSELALRRGHPLEALEAYRGVLESPGRRGLLPAALRAVLRAAGRMVRRS